jgi:hypothetical protein
VNGPYACGSQHEGQESRHHSQLAHHQGQESVATPPTAFQIRQCPLGEQSTPTHHPTPETPTENSIPYKHAGAGSLGTETRAPAPQDIQAAQEWWSPGGEGGGSHPRKAPPKATGRAECQRLSRAARAKYAFTIIPPAAGTNMSADIADSFTSSQILSQPSSAQHPPFLKHSVPQARARSRESCEICT